MPNHNNVAVLASHPFVERAFWAGLTAGLLGTGLILHNTPWNLELMIWARTGSWLPPYLWMSITVLGTGWVAILLVSMLDRHTSLCSLSALGALILGGLLVTLIKHWIPSPRPLRVLGIQSMQVIGQYLSGMNSMPSGHALCAMAAVTVMILFLRSSGRGVAGITLLLLASGLLVSASRVAVGAHWPADVFVGAALGVATGLLCWKFSLLCQQRWGTLSPKIPIFFECLVVCYAPFEKNAYPEVQPLLWFIIAAAIISVACRLYRLYWVAGNRISAG
jgi:membrane-associated phospholipid phosphatase